MRRRNPAVAAIFAALLLAAISLLAQQPSPVTVTITVSDDTGGRISNAKIRVVPLPAPEPKKMETDARGELSLILKPGGYALFVSSLGFVATTMHFEASGSKEAQTIPVVLRAANIGGVEVSAAEPSNGSNLLTLSAYPYRGVVTLSPADLKVLPHTSVTVHNPHANADETYSGVPLADLLTKMRAPLGKDLRGPALATYIVATGEDGYQVILSLAEIDPEFHPGTVLVADSMNGHPLDPNSGPFKLVVTEDKRPARWVRNLTSIELKSLN
ncbi:MAG: molybdopterin-dependent oxidoreductase [Candidatus Acidiferrales bacterium]